MQVLLQMYNDDHQECESKHMVLGHAVAEHVHNPEPNSGHVRQLITLVETTYYYDPSGDLTYVTTHGSFPAREQVKKSTFWRW